MKRRIAFTLAAIMATTMLSACGGNTPSETQSQTSEADSDTSEVTTENSTSSADTTSSAPDATTSAATSETTTATTAPAEPVVPEDLPLITAEPIRLAYSSYIMNGCMAFKQDGKNYVYNITENELYETEHDVSELAVIKGNMAVFGSVSDIRFDKDKTNAFVMNLKTGEKYDDVKPIYSFWELDYRGNYITVGKVEKGFSDATTSIGMLNDKGEWVMPLSSDYAVSDFDPFLSELRQNNEMIFSSYASPTFVYDIANDKIIALDDGFDVWSITDDAVITYSEDLFYKYDISTNENTFICDRDNMYELYNSGCWVIRDNNIYKIYDKSLNLIQEYDLSEYNNVYVKDANEKLIVFVAKGADGEQYTLIQTNDGKLICDPIKGNKESLMREDKVALWNVRGNTIYIIDINTGETTKYNDFNIIDVDVTNKLFLVESDGAYYFADPEAPETLINPFERANS